jgi:hypothetical protein
MMSPPRNLQVVSVGAASSLSPDQKRFNNLIQQIEQARGTLAAWNENIALYISAYAQTIQPLVKSYVAVRREWIFALDGVLGRVGWTTTERVTLHALVRDGVRELLDEIGEDDQELKALFNSRSAVDFDTEQHDRDTAMKNVLASVLAGDASGMHADPDRFDILEEGLDAGRGARTPEHAAGLRRRARAERARARLESDANLAAQSVREVFRKLASALHPDRELDPTQRDVKTALMQRVNQAYAANDLLGLLELQLQIEQIDANHFSNLDGRRIKHYNKVLAEQLEELNAAVLRVAPGFQTDFGLEINLDINSKKLVGIIDKQRKALRTELSSVQHDMRLLADRDATKRWLKLERQRIEDTL